MKAVMYGAGNIGRGFIGTLFAGSGFEVTFIDIAEDIVERLHREHRYPVRIVSDRGYEDREITGVDAVNGKDTEAAAQAIAEADIMATAVGVKVLPFIAPLVAAGIRKRFAVTTKPLNIIICENLMDANAVFEGLLKEQLSPEERDQFDRQIGLVEAAIGRMVPVQTAEMQDGDPLRVCVEPYGFLPVDKDAFKGDIPCITGMIPCAPFGFYIKRKLYVHNMGHALCAYLGSCLGIEYIWQAIKNPDIRLLAQNAMLESARSLSSCYGFPMGALLNHIDDLLCRFGNAALGDTCKRVGADPVRKLSPADRLIGAASFCLNQKICPAYISAGAAGAVYQYLADNKRQQTEENAMEVLEHISGVKAGSDLAGYILNLYGIYRCGGGAAEIRQTAEELRAEKNRDVV
ncbi:MAG: mannitol-1-phosphate 5-dehydrogenase [Treponema sp.]|jgi:mannitol-1-phosphate 5-dehydrogenase|nr:mannitol-1-phosphate 5-dehydrogenase [Treponema sp.]